MRRAAGRERERGAVLSLYAVAMGFVLVALATSFLSGSSSAARKARATEAKAEARALARGALLVVVHRHAADAMASGSARDVTVEVGGREVACTIRPAEGGRAHVEARAAAVAGADRVRVTLAADLVATGGGGPPRVERVAAMERAP